MTFPPKETAYNIYKAPCGLTERDENGLLLFPDFVVTCACGKLAMLNYNPERKNFEGTLKGQYEQVGVHSLAGKCSFFYSNCDLGWHCACPVWDMDKHRTIEHRQKTVMTLSEYRVWEERGRFMMELAEL